MKDGRLWFYQSERYPLLRIEMAQGFGIFAEDVMIEPGQWVIDGIKDHAAGLKILLDQAPPKKYLKFFYHVLVLDHEVRPVVHAARLDGLRFDSMSVNGGQFLINYGKFVPSPKELEEDTARKKSGTKSWSPPQMGANIVNLGWTRLEI